MVEQRLPSSKIDSRTMKALREKGYLQPSTDGTRWIFTRRASKHALESYSRAAATELGPLGITVNVVSLGPVQTGYIRPERAEQLAAEIPLRRIGQPEDVADVILFFASEQARWVTGQLLYVGGGHTMPL